MAVAETACEVAEPLVIAGTGAIREADDSVVASTVLDEGEAQNFL